MASTRDAESEERERLERFLEWRRATGREPKLSRWRWLSYVAGIAVLGVIVLALAALLTGDLRGTRERLANAPERLADAPERLADAGGQSPVASAQLPAVPVHDITPPRAPTSDVSPQERPSRLEHSERGGSRAAGEALALPPRSPAQLRTSVSPPPTTLQERSHPSDVSGPTLLPGPTSTRSEIRTTPSAPPAPMSAPPGAQDAASESRTEGSSIVSPTPPIFTAPSAAPPPPPPSTTIPTTVPNAAPAEPPVSTPPVAAPSAAPRAPSSGTPTPAATSTPA